MNGAWPDDITHHLTIRVAGVDGGPTREKTIPRITEADATGYRKLGAGAAQFLGHALNMAFNRVPNFYERVVAYRLVHDEMATTFEEALDRSYVTIEFYASADDDAPTSRPEPEYAFAELSLPMLFEWLEPHYESLDSSIASEPDAHVKVQVGRHEHSWHVEVRLERYSGPDTDFAGSVSYSITAGVIYGVPPVPEFADRFNAQGLDTRVRWAWASRVSGGRDMMHVTFALRHEMNVEDTITRQTLVDEVRHFVDEVYEGTLATEMRWIFSRAGEL